MRNIIYVLTVAALMAAAIMPGCETPTQKENADKANLQVAKKESEEMQIQLPEEYQAFKKIQGAKIDSNNLQIANLKATLSGITDVNLINERKQKIDTLEVKNNELKNRLYGYEKAPTGWQSFKKKFNDDMNNLDFIFRNSRKNS